MRWLRRLFCLHTETYVEQVWSNGAMQWRESYWECLRCGASSGTKMLGEGSE